MTRKEEILNKAIDYSEIEDNFLEYDDCEDVCDYKCADTNPKKELIYTGQEIAERSQRYINYQRNKWIEGACEYLESSLKNDLGYYGTAEFVNAFKKAMEEQL